jgi:hypothetical protein
VRQRQRERRKDQTAQARATAVDAPPLGRAARVGAASADPAFDVMA